MLGAPDLLAFSEGGGGSNRYTVYKKKHMAIARMFALQLWNCCYAII